MPATLPPSRCFPLAVTQHPELTFTLGSQHSEPVLSFEVTAASLAASVAGAGADDLGGASPSIPSACRLQGWSFEATTASVLMQALSLALVVPQLEVSPQEGVEREALGGDDGSRGLEFSFSRVGGFIEERG